MIKRMIGIILSLALLLSLLPAALAASDGSFDDVADGDWYAEAAEAMSQDNLMQGVGNRKFDPQGAVNRGMVVTILHRMEGMPAPSVNSTFRDVTPDSYYATAIAWAAEQKIVLGYSEDSFGPNDSITREQLALILFRYASWKGCDVDAAANLSAYADAEDISDYAVTAFSWANALGLITGTTPSTLTPQGTASRAQIAVILLRFQQAYGLTGIIDMEPEPDPIEPTPLPEPIDDGAEPEPEPDPNIGELDPDPVPVDDPIPTPEPVRPSI